MSDRPPARAHARFWLIRLAATTCVAALSVAMADTPQRRPLRPPQGPQPENSAPEEEGPEQLYYYSNGTKIFMFDTGLAVAKPKEARAPDAAAPDQPVALDADDALRDLLPTLRQEGLELIRTDRGGPEGLNLAPFEQDFEFTWPIIVTGPAAAGPVDEEEAPRSSTRAIMKPEIVAQFAPDVDVADYIEEFGLEVEAEKRSSRGKAGEVVARNYVLSLEADGADYVRLIQAANALYERGRQDGRVNHAHPNFVPIRRKQQLDEIEDPRFGNQWHLHNDGSSGGVEDADIDAPEAWRLTTGRPEVRVAIIDDSVERDHPDLPDGFLGRYYGGLGEGEEDDPSPRTYRQRHGTACAGVAVGVGNDQGIRGSAPDCGLIGVHFWDADLAQTAEAFRFSADPDDDPATDDGAAVISCSWSWNAAFDAVRDAVVEVATTARGGRGAVVLFAAGNGDRETLMALPIESQQFFGSLDEVICVGATNWRDDHCTYSNFGPELDVVAPSNDPLRVGALSIDTTDNTQDAPRHPVTDIAGYASGDYTGNGATGFGGTSSATPTTAGVCGLLLTVNPELTAAQVRSILEHTTDRVRGNLRKATYDPTTGHDPYYGFGRINAKNAVLTARDSLTNPHSTWPDRVADLAATRENGSIVRVEWVNPAADVSGVLVVRGPEPIRWRPHDGERYVVGDEVGGDAVVVAVGATESFEDDSGVRPSHFAIYAYNGDRLYSWGRMVESPF